MILERARRFGPWLLSLVAFQLSAGAAAAQLVGELARLEPSAPSSQDGRFGAALALDQGTAVVGAPENQAVYVYVLQGSTWVEQARIAYPGAASAEFGHAVALAGDTLFVGAWLDGAFAQGAVYVYQRNGGAWTLTAQLGASRPRVDARFGSALAVHGGTLAIGALRDNGGVASSGAVYVFTGSGSSWSEVAKLAASPPRSGDDFGFQLQLTSTHLLVGMSAAGGTARRSTVHLFTGAGASWTLEALFAASEPTLEYRFGWLEGDRLALSALDRFSGRGSVVVLERGPTGWSETSRVVPQSNSSDGFGFPVVLDGERLFTAVQSHDGLGRGAFYVFRRHGTRWVEEQMLDPDDGSPYGLFGAAFVLESGRLLVGDPLEGTLGAIDGAAYVLGDVVAPPGPSLTAVSPAIVEALIPGTEPTVALAGNALDLATTWTLDGVPIDPARLTRVDDRFVLLDMPQANRRGTLALGVSDGTHTDTHPITVVEVAAPRLEVGSGDPGQSVPHGASLSFRIAGTPQSFGGAPIVQGVYASTSLLPSISPQLSLAIGDSFRSLVRAGWYTIPNRGWIEVQIPSLPDPGLVGLTFHVQAFELRSPTPWRVSNVQSILILP